jgi:hypothetical protein
VADYEDEDDAHCSDKERERMKFKSRQIVEISRKRYKKLEAAAITLGLMGWVRFSSSPFLRLKKFPSKKGEQRNMLSALNSTGKSILFLCQILIKQRGSIWLTG